MWLERGRTRVYLYPNPATSDQGLLVSDNRPSHWEWPISTVDSLVWNGYSKAELTSLYGGITTQLETQYLL